MITESKVFKIGKFTKPHGIKGEIAFAFDDDVFDRVDCPYLICQIDGIFVPFFIEEYRFKGKETALIKFEDIDDEQQVQRFSGLDVYFPREYCDEVDEDAIYSWNFFIGFTAIDSQAGRLGIIEEVDDKTINTLFLIRDEQNEYIIPAVEDFIENIDAQGKAVYFNLPEGLVDIQ